MDGDACGIAAAFWGRGSPRARTPLRVVKEAGATKGLSLAELFSQAESEPLTEIVEGIIRPGVTLLFGESGAGKSFFVQRLALDVSRGRDFLGKKTLRRGVVYAALEDSSASLAYRLSVIEPKISEHLDGAWLRVLTAGMVPGAGAGGYATLERELLAVPWPGLLIVDTLGKLDDADSGDAYQSAVRFMAPFKNIAARLNVALLLVHHSPKRNRYVPTGSAGIPASADWRINLLRETERHLLKMSGRLGLERSETVQLPGWRYSGSPRTRAPREKKPTDEARIAELLRQRGAMKVAAAAKELAPERAPSLEAAMRRMIRTGKAFRPAPGAIALPASA